ncbi:hypothetical protein L9F63_001161, partial [Diploptera punctata]
SYFVLNKLKGKLRVPKPAMLIRAGTTLPGWTHCRAASRSGLMTIQTFVALKCSRKT